MAAVEAEGPLVEVGLEVLGADRALQRPGHPALDQREHRVHGRQHLVRLLSRGGHVGRLVLVEAGGRPRVGAPAVGDHPRSRLDAVLEEGAQVAGADVVDDRKAGTAEPARGLKLDGGGEQHLAERAAARRACLGTAQVGLIDLDLTAEPIPPRSHHRLPVAVQHRPGGLVGAQLHLPSQLGG